MHIYIIYPKTSKLVNYIYGYTSWHELNNTSLLIRKNAVELLMEAIYKWGTFEVKSKANDTTHWQCSQKSTCIFNTKAFQLDYFWKISKLATYAF